MKKKGRVIRDEGRGEGNTEHTKERRGGAGRQSGGVKDSGAKHETKHEINCYYSKNVMLSVLYFHP